ALASCGSLAGLRALHLRGTGMAKRVAAFAGSPLAASLQALALADDPLTADDLACLGETFPRLRRLGLSGFPFDRKKLDALLGGGWPEALDSLQLTRSLPSSFIARLLGSPRLAGLAELNLSDNYV